MKNIRTIAILLSVLGLAACSVHSRQVDNHPPAFIPPVFTFGATYGTIDHPQTFSTFLWPENLTDQQTEDLVSLVNGTSMQIDQLTIDLHQMLIQKTTLEAQFATDQCVAKWADDPSAIDWIEKWKTSGDHSEQDEIQKCIANQDSRKALQVQIDQNQSVDQPAKFYVVLSAIDPGYPDHIENSRNIDASGSSLALLPDAKGQIVVHVTLKDFVNPGHVQSTDTADIGQIVNAKYDPSMRYLTFDVPELDADGKLTGLNYHFAMERSADFIGYARFKGDMNLMKSNRILRHGSAKIDGTMTPP